MNALAACKTLGSKRKAKAKKAKKKAKRREAYYGAYSR